MNILPKKKWHVRTKDNIARVRKDEGEALEQEKIRQEKLELAESEARINFLRKKSGLLPEEHKVENKDLPASNTFESDAKSSRGQHVDLFSDYKSHVKTTNKDLEKEQKEEKEKYEKQIGYLTYLGQDTNEALKLRSWYEVAPKRASVGDDSGIVEKDIKNKFTHDPLTLINALLPPEKNINSQPQQKTIKHSCEVGHVCLETPRKRRKLSEESPKHKKAKKIKKHKVKHSNKKKRQREDKRANDVEEQLRKKEMIEKLRKERLRREASERMRQEALLAPPKETSKLPKTAATPRIVQKYNSQFNPELAKQNML